MVDIIDIIDVIDIIGGVDIIDIIDIIDVIDIMDGVGVGRVTTPYWSLLRLKRQGFIVVGICDYRAKLIKFSSF